jgi:hypothetical protein
MHQQEASTGSSSSSKESSTMRAIRKLRESGKATVADYEKLLAPNVVFHSPVLIRALEGRAVVAKIFATSTTLREGAYTGEWKLDDRRTLLRWKGKIQGRELESLDIIEENDEGLIVDRTIAFRPMPAAKLFRDAMRSALGSAVPDDFWEYSD